MEINKLIAVVQGFYPNEFNSLSETVEAAAKIKELKKLKIESINGKTVTDYQFNGTVLIVSFNNGQWLIISPGEKLINWDVVSIKPIMMGEIIEQNIHFQLTNGNKILWDWKTILDGFLGKQVVISPSDQYLFIFSRNGDEYMFDFLVDKCNPDKKYLYISKA